jgi:hypothetical protein
MWLSNSSAWIWMCTKGMDSCATAPPLLGLGSETATKLLGPPRGVGWDGGSRFDPAAAERGLTTAAETADALVEEIALSGWHIPCTN